VKTSPLFLGFVFLAGCHVRCNAPRTVVSFDFERAVQKNLEKEPTLEGVSVTRVICEDGDDVEVGHVYWCGVELDRRKTYPLDVKVTALEGSTVKFEMTWRQLVVSERAIRRELGPSIERDLGVPAEIDCGEPLVMSGEDGTARCGVTVDDIQTKLVLRFDATSGKVNIDRLEDRLLSVPTLNEILTRSVHEKLGAEARVECPSGKLIRRPDDGVLHCVVTDGERRASLRVDIDEDLNVKRWETKGL